jgi:hypothetical protein
MCDICDRSKLLSLDCTMLRTMSVQHHLMVDFPPLKRSFAENLKMLAQKEHWKPENRKK